MKTLKILLPLVAILFIIIFFSCKENNSLTVEPSQQTDVLAKKQKDTAIVSVFVSGLNNPRGLKFGPDGYLYVAEGGLGGSMTTTETQCVQVPGAGPYSGGFNSRISKISPKGTRTTVIDGLPSSQTNPQLGSLVSGVADIAFIHGRLYGIEAGAGCSHGLEGTDNTIFRVNPNGTKTDIANLSDYQKANPVKNPEPDDFEPDGTWYSMLSVNDELYAIEPNHGELVKVNPFTGRIKRVIDVSAKFGHIVPTSMDYKGEFYIGNLNTFPSIKGSSIIFKVNKRGKAKVYATGFTNVLGVAFDKKENLYVLEMSAIDGGPAPNTGRVVRINHHGERKVIVDSLFFPTAMTFGPDGDLYISNKGFGLLIPGFGEILKVELNAKGEHNYKYASN